MNDYYIVFIYSAVFYHEYNIAVKQLQTPLPQGALRIFFLAIRLLYKTYIKPKNLVGKGQTVNFNFGNSL